MSPWKNVVMLAHSFSLPASCVHRMEAPPKNPTYRIGPDDVGYHLVFFSTFEDLELPISGPMERAGVTKLYEPSPAPCLYVAPASCMVGRVPLIPLSLAGDSTPKGEAEIVWEEGWVGVERRRCLPRPNCHSHWFTSYALQPRRPSAAAVSQLPIGKPELL
jgi:hypothetical protein